MGWATAAIGKLQAGEQVLIHPRGNSMRPLVNSGDPVLVDPDISNLKKGDIVLCKVRGRQYLHLVKALEGQRVQIGNNKGHINGWVGINSVYGKAIKIG